MVRSGVIPFPKQVLSVGTQNLTFQNLKEGTLVKDLHHGEFILPGELAIT